MKIRDYRVQEVTPQPSFEVTPKRNVVRSSRAGGAIEGRKHCVFGPLTFFLPFLIVVSLQRQDIAPRLLAGCVGDLGAPGYKKYDIEAYFPSFGGYREVTSNTNLTEFQSRRLDIRYKDGDERGFVHTISATAATDRMLICIMENYQQADGSIIVPEVLRPYTGFDRIVPAK